ncbi:MAG: uroporphyrinogen decarboxylase [Actinomycetota bacterium]
MQKPSEDLRFMRACRMETTDVRPVWMMRQAGRTLPAYRELRAKYSFLELMDQADLCAQVTMMPLKVMDLDAAIMFADIMTTVAGLAIEYQMVEGTGPIIGEPITSLTQVENMPQVSAFEAVPRLLEAIKIVRGEVEGKVPLLGFAGAPFTLASYLVEGRPTRDFTKTKALMRTESRTWHALMERLVTTIVDYLEQQVHSGIQAFQIFDSWVGELDAAEYREYVLPHSRRVFAETDRLGVPRIHFGTGTGRTGLLEALTEVGGEIIGVDWRLEIADAWDRIGDDRGIQGNLNPEVLLGDPGDIRQATNEILAATDGRPGHIFNLGHGVLPATPVENMQLLVDTVHSHSLSLN